MDNLWNQITLNEFSQIRDILADESRDAEDRMVSLAAVVQGVSEEEILTMPLDEVSPVFDLVGQLDSKPTPSRLREIYKVGTWTLRTTDKKMTLAQWLDFQNYMRAGGDRYADILSVVLVPVGKSYNEDYDMAALKSALGQMSVADALAVCFFFQRKYLRSMRRILTFLVGAMKLKKGDRKVKKALIKEALKVRRQVSDMLRSL